MNREQFVRICDMKTKLVRTEFDLTQEKMAVALGISKKTLVEIEKERKSLGWTTSVALCTIFSESEVIDTVFGGRPTDIILALAFEGAPPHYHRTLGGKIWWVTIRENNYCLIQQNILSQHYRLMTKDRRRIASSFQLEDLLPLFDTSNEGIRD